MELAPLVDGMSRRGNSNAHALYCTPLFSQHRRDIKKTRLGSHTCLIFFFCRPEKLLIYKPPILTHPNYIPSKPFKHLHKIQKEKNKQNMNKLN